MSKKKRTGKRKNRPQHRCPPAVIEQSSSESQVARTIETAPKLRDTGTLIVAGVSSFVGSTLSGVAGDAISSALGLGFQGAQHPGYPSVTDSIMQSRQWIEDNKSRGVECPTCGKHVEEYRRSISSSQAQTLKAMHSRYRTNFINLAKMRVRLKVDPHGEITKLAHWGLIQQHPKLGGVWSVTERGEKWIEGSIQIPRSIYVYQGEMTGQCIHRVSFLESQNGAACSHTGVAELGENDPYREEAQSSDNMYNFKSLSERRGKIASPTDSNDELLGALVADKSPLHHEYFTGDESIEKAREWVERKLSQKGGYCPSCDKIAAYNRTNMTDTHARLLLEMYKRCGTEPVHVPTFMFGEEPLGKNGHASESAHRGLLKVETNADGSVKSGVYSLTEAGVAWIKNLGKTPESIWSYNRFSRMIENERQVSVKDVFERSSRYDYSDLALSEDYY